VTEDRGRFTAYSVERDESSLRQAQDKLTSKIQRSTPTGRRCIGPEVSGFRKAQDFALLNIECGAASRAVSTDSSASVGMTLHF